VPIADIAGFHEGAQEKAVTSREVNHNVPTCVPNATYKGLNIDADLEHHCLSGRNPEKVVVIKLKSLKNFCVWLQVLPVQGTSVPNASARRFIHRLHTSSLSLSQRRVEEG
jgi:hypothetical protein